LGGNVRRVRLQADTKTAAVVELRALQVDYERGEQHKSGVGLTLAELAVDYVAHLRARVGDTDPRRRRSPRTVHHYDEQLRRHVPPGRRRLRVCGLAIVGGARLALARRRPESRDADRHCAAWR